MEVVFLLVFGEAVASLTPLFAILLGTLVVGAVVAVLIADRKEGRK